MPVNLFAGHDLTCRRGERLVFAGLSFRIADGGALLLRGPNGSGKSSLLRVMAGLTPLLSGDLRWGEGAISADRLAHNTRCHYVGHQDALKPALTVRENLQLWQWLRGTGAGAIDTALERLGIGQLADLPARLLSAGQRRRLSLARLAAIPAPLWLLDEPATALDSDGAARLDAILRTHLAGGGRAVVSSHSEVGGGRLLNLGDFRPSPQDLAA